MIIDFTAIDTERTYDVCIVGSGPAGMTCALELAKQGKQVLLLEGGDNSYSAESQEIYAGKTIGDTYYALDETRLRQLGGSSGLWSGWCRRLDESDFREKAHNPYSVWPISKSDLDPYYDRARDILDIAPIDSGIDPESDEIAASHFRYSTVSFAEKFGDEITNSQSIRCALRSNLLEILTDGNSVTGLKIADYAGSEKQVRANAYVLACGGIENSRVLLWSNEKSNGALVKNAAMLGMYWMEHPEAVVGEAVLNHEHFSFDEVGVCRFTPKPSTMQQEEILNCSIELHKSAYSATHTTVYSMTRKMIANLACVAPTYGSWAFKMLGKELVCGALVRAAWEQGPRAENCVVLGKERDRFGIPRSELHWRKSEADLKTVRVMTQKVAEFVAAKDIGRIRIKPWVLGEEPEPVDKEPAGHHHMGGTRMAADATQGIVDSDCRVFGQPNLFIAGSSVFPSSGYANPTFTIVQLALRLSEKLATEV